MNRAEKRRGSPGERVVIVVAIITVIMVLELILRRRFHLNPYASYGSALAVGVGLSATLKAAFWRLFGVRFD